MNPWLRGELATVTGLNEQSIIEASVQFWKQMVAMKVEPVGCADGCSMSSGHLHGVVKLHGAWNGRVDVRMTKRLAHEATAAMLMQASAQVSEADKLDATKEIANILGGVIKSSLPRPCTMTLPEATIEAEEFCVGNQFTDAIVVGFHHAWGDMIVSASEEGAER